MQIPKIKVCTSAVRSRRAGEIVPVSAEQSATRDNDEENYGAGRAIDLVLATYSHTVAGTDGSSWLQINLGKAHCIEQVISYYSPTLHHTWTCTKYDCSNCVGNWCNRYMLIVSIEGPVSDLSLTLNCKYGDTVILDHGFGGFNAYEVITIGKQGKHNFLMFCSRT